MWTERGLSMSRVSPSPCSPDEKPEAGEKGKDLLKAICNCSRESGLWGSLNRRN